MNIIFRTGNDELAAHYILKDLNKNKSEQFSKFFLDALTKNGESISYYSSYINIIFTKVGHKNCFKK